MSPRKLLSVQMLDPLIQAIERAEKSDREYVVFPLPDAQALLQAIQQDERDQLREAT